MSETRTFSVVLLGVVLASSAHYAICPAAEPKPIWLAVAEADLSASLKPLAEKRRSEGFEVVVSTETVEAAVAGLPRRPKFLLLASQGDADLKNTGQQLPAKLMKLYRWRNTQPAWFLSDMAWGDLDGDGIPDVPVGRIPARTPAELQLVVKKILAYESQPPTSADLQVALWLGSPGYDATINEAKLRRDQILMYEIFGDPATRLRLPERLEATIERTATGWRWKAQKPAGAVHLEVGYRSARPLPTSWKGPRAGKNEAARSFEAANAGFAFVPLRSPPDDRVWQGEVERSGWIRLVTNDKNRLFVAVLRAE